MLLPRLAAFDADLLFISAGFDAHFDDYYHFLTEADLHWVTEQLCSVADASGGRNGGRRCGVISVLEGGYSLSSPIPKPTKTARAPASAACGVSAAGVPSVPLSVSATNVAEPAVPASIVTSPTADAALGRGGRLKAKKGAPIAIPVVAPAVAPAVVSSGVVESPECKVPATAAISPTGYAQSEDTMYAQRPGDGGLVKG